MQLEYSIPKHLFVSHYSVSSLIWTQLLFFPLSLRAFSLYQFSFICYTNCCSFLHVEASHEMHSLYFSYLFILGVLPQDLHRMF